MENYRPKEISWLAFNERVLQEAGKAHVPIIERFRFLGIYSNNLDEFFRVRFATLKRLSELGAQLKFILGGEPAEILKEVSALVLKQRKQYEAVFSSLITDLEKEGIFFLNEKSVDEKQADFILRYFYSKVRPKLMPIMIDQVQKFPDLDDDSIYLAVVLSKEGKDKKRFALIKVPTDELPRFLILPRVGQKKNLMFLDDVIRFGLGDLFHVQNYDHASAYTIKLTKDAELDIDDDLGESYVNKVSRGLKKREDGVPVRLVYDNEIPAYFLNYLKKRLGLTDVDAAIPGSRYHNLKDFMQIPNLGSDKLTYPPLPPLRHPDFSRNTSVFASIRKKDIMLHFPYHSFDHFIDLLREASIDPKVSEIKISIYRLASQSNVISALLNALRNGKRVLVVVELTARFNEKSNIEYSELLLEEGARIIYGVPGLKVHAKLCQITRKNKGTISQYSILGTGNFNEDTAKVFSDILLFTHHPQIGSEVEQLFNFFRKNYNVGEYHYLIPSPFTMRDSMSKWIRQEIYNAQQGKPAYIHLKLNNLVDQEIIQLLNLAAGNGVEVKLNVRGMLSLVMPQAEQENFKAIALIDRFLEHTRLFFFCNGGQEKLFFSSADLMTRNLDRRVEVTCPVLDPQLHQELRTMFDIQWADNTQARILDSSLSNQHVPKKGQAIRSQVKFYQFLKRGF